MMTSVNADKYIKPHIGKWIKVQSTIQDISENEHYFYVLLGKWSDPALICALRKNYGDQK